jgi:hypothetical protein
MMTNCQSRSATLVAWIIVARSPREQMRMLRITSSGGVISP